MVESTGSSFRGPRFDSQHTQGGSSLPVTPIPGNPASCPGFLGNHANTCKHVITHKRKTKQTRPFWGTTTRLKEMNHWGWQNQNRKCCQEKNGFPSLFQVIRLYQILKGKKKRTGQAVVVHTFNHSTLKRQRQVDLCEFKASLVYKS